MIKKNKSGLHLWSLLSCIEAECLLQMMIQYRICAWISLGCRIANAIIKLDSIKKTQEEQENRRKNMPTQTFYNLAKEKQDKIIRVSKEEFSEYSFYDASINRIVKNAGISRGSFYLYFENKEDLFIYLLEQCKTQLISAIMEKMKESKIDLFELVILVFDYLTNEKLNKNDRDFIVKTFSTMDLKLSKHLLNFEGINLLNEEAEHIKERVNMENLKLSQEDCCLLMDMLRSIFVNDIGMVFEKCIEKEEAKNNLIKKMNFIRYGIN